jgi:hypothetical protein
LSDFNTGWLYFAFGGLWIARQFGLPEPLLITIKMNPFPAVVGHRFRRF